MKTRKSIISILLLALLFACGRGSSGNPPFPPPSHHDCTISFVGDSITSGGPWEELSTPESPICNEGVPGNTTIQVLQRIDSIIDSGTSTVFLMIGINDALLGGRPALYVFEDIQEIVYQLEGAGIEVIIQSVLHTTGKFSYLNCFVFKLNGLLDDWCWETGRLFIDLNAVLSEESKLKEEYSKDGLHINDAGYQAWVAILVEEGYFE